MQLHRGYSDEFFTQDLLTHNAHSYMCMKEARFNSFADTMDLKGCSCDVGVVMPKRTSHAQGKCKSKAYPYQNLPSPTSIRLLKIPLLETGIPHCCEKDLFSRLELSLVTVDLDKYPAYTALSYTASSSSPASLRSAFTYSTISPVGRPEDILSEIGRNCLERGLVLSMLYDRNRWPGNYNSSKPLCSAIVNSIHQISR
jgi:hypothetical protein